MALFGKKNNDDNGQGDTPPPPEAFSPKKAGNFFDHAQTVHASSNYEYAMQLWLNGLRWDPTSMDGLTGFLKAADAFLSENPKGKISKETRSGIAAKGPVGKYVDALLDFGIRKDDAGASVKAATAAAALGLKEPGKFLGRFALTQVANDPKKQKKDIYVKLLDVFETAEDFQIAAQAGEAAMRLDPSDAALQNRVRNMMAQATMSKGGFDETGEGGFRKNIRDSKKQQELVESEVIAKTDAAKASLLAKAKAAYEQRPDDLPTVEAYCKALLERGKTADELKAMTVYNQLHKKTGQFRYRKRSGDIQLRLMRRNINKLHKAAKANPDDTEAQEKLAAAQKSLADKELSELKIQVENYPTDLHLKYKLGKSLAARGEHDDAIAQFQQAQNDAKVRQNVLLDMGHSFQALGGWDDAAIETYRKALSDMHDHETDLGMELRYGLMAALQNKAANDRDAALADEAYKIASAIAVKSFSYKDIRDRRQTLKALREELKA